MATNENPRGGRATEGLQVCSTGREEHPVDTQTPARLQAPSIVADFLEPDRGEIEKFVSALFRRVDHNGYISLRAFYDDDPGGKERAFAIKAVSLQTGLVPVIDAAEDLARRAANAERKIVFCPPLAVFANKGGKQKDLHAAPALSIDADKHPRQSKALLEAILGPVTVAVKSGGTWTDPNTGEVEDKLHLHWLLKQLAVGTEALAKLKRARALANVIVDGDVTNNPISHPQRWPGSWHRKGDPRLCTIAEINDVEIDLDAALAALEKEVGPYDEEVHQSSDPQAEPWRLAEAMALIPATGLDYNGWNRLVMALFRGTGGSDDGLKILLAWSRQAEEIHDDERNEDKWDHLKRSPPRELGAGTLFYEAEKECPGWRTLAAFGESEVARRISAFKKAAGIVEGAGGARVSLSDFYAYMPTHNYIYTPAREHWPASSVNARVGLVLDTDADGKPRLNEDGEPQFIHANKWLDEHRPVEQMTWAPGEPLNIRDRLTSNGGWIEHRGASVFNLFRPPTLELGDPDKAGPWIDHLNKIYPDDSNHISLWFASRVQRPEVKINHALVLGSNDHGIGKDTLIEGPKRAVGHWNFNEASPQKLMGRFTGFLKCVILRVNEVRDLGETSRYQFYDHMKACTAAPPDMLLIDEKFRAEYHVLNCVGIVYTTNHKTNGIYLPPEDRRHYVAWSECKKGDFGEDYWNGLWDFYNSGGDRHVAAYLRSLDLKEFDAKAPPPKTRAFYDIVDANRASEDSELADLLDAMGNPVAITLKALTDELTVHETANGLCQMKLKYSDFSGLYVFLTDRRNRKVVAHRLEDCDYARVGNPDADDGLWKIAGRRQAVYAKNTLSVSDQLKAVRKLTKKKIGRVGQSSQ
jgi:hypothetical protein